MTLATRVRWFFWNGDVGPEVVDLPFFYDFIDGRRQTLVQDITGAMVLSRILQWWRLGVSSGVSLDGAGVGRRPLATVVARNPRNRFVFLDHLGFYLQIQDNYLILVCLLISTCVAYYNRFFD
jgi:hypothetical protein